MYRKIEALGSQTFIFIIKRKLETKKALLISFYFASYNSKKIYSFSDRTNCNHDDSMSAFSRAIKPYNVGFPKLIVLLFLIKMN